MLLLEYTTQNTGEDLTTSGWLGQRFSLYRDAPVGRVQLYLKTTGSPSGVLWIEIYSDDSGNPDAMITNGKSKGVKVSSLASAYGYIDFDFYTDNRPSLTSATDYHIVLKSTGYTYTDGTTEVVWGCDQTDPAYLDGEGEVYDGSWSNIATATDFDFKLYSRRRSVYSELQEVEALIKHATATGQFSSSSNITATAIMDIQEDISDEIDTWLAGAGFDTPVTSTSAINILKPYAKWGVMMGAELTQRSAGFRAQGGADTRTGAFRSLYHYLRDEIRSGGALVDSLIDAGLERSSTGSLAAGLTAGHIDEDERDDYRDDDDIIQPLFQSDMWDND
jgi:hypothetical protein